MCLALASTCSRVVVQIIEKNIVIIDLEKC